MPCYTERNFTRDPPMTPEINLSEGDGDYPGSAQIVADLIRALAAGSPPDRWEHDIAYNYLVHQGTVLNLGIQAFPHLIAVLNDCSLDQGTSESLVHLCAMIFPTTQRANTDRLALLGQIGELLQPDRQWADKVHLLSAYARVAAADDLFAESLESLLETTCPHCGEIVLNELQDRKQ